MNDKLTNLLKPSEYSWEYNWNVQCSECYSSGQLNYEGEKNNLILIKF